MKIVLLTPGTGNFHCGSCIRDYALARAMRDQGMDAVILSMYLPPVLDQTAGTADTAGENTGPGEVYFGGVNVYLQHKLRLFRSTPRWLDRLFDSRWLLRLASSRAGMTRANELGELTVSMLQGEEGRQVKELDRLVHALEHEFRPDLVILSNAMLIGVARRIHAMGIPVICTLQGEDGFLDSLPEPYRAQAWRTLRERAADVDGFIPVSQFHGTHMKDRLGLREDRLHVVHNGLDLSPFNGTTNAVPPAEPTIGYFARLCKDKGLGCLVDAYLILRRESPEPVQLLIGGAMTKTDEPFVDRMQARLREAGVEGEVTWRPNTDLAGKVRLLQSCSVFSVPATYGESFGLYVIEALACGVPVVQPNHAAFPELLAVTGGGVLVPPDDPAALARAWRNLIADPARARELGYAGRTKVLSHFTAARMATDVLAVCRKVTSRGPQPT